MSKINPEAISIFQINVFKSIVSPSETFIDNPQKPTNFRVGYSHNFAFNFELKNVRMRLEVMLDGIDEKEELIGIQGNFGIEFHFHIVNLEEFLENKEGENKIQGILGTTLLSIAFSTSRGIILEKTLNTPLNGIILPVIDPSAMIKMLPSQSDTL
jgi:hypothetical protein